MGVHIIHPLTHLIFQLLCLHLHKTLLICISISFSTLSFVFTSSIYWLTLTLNLYTCDSRTYGNLCMLTDFTVPSTPVQDSFQIPLRLKDKLCSPVCSTTASPLGKILRCNDHSFLAASCIVYNADNWLCFAFKLPTVQTVPTFEEQEPFWKRKYPLGEHPTQAR